MHAFIQTMRSLIYMPLESLQQILCTMNYVMNGEKLSLEDIVLRGSAETQSRSTQQKPMMDRPSLKKSTTRWQLNKP